MIKTIQINVDDTGSLLNIKGTPILIMGTEFKLKMFL